MQAIASPKLNKIAVEFKLKAIAHSVIAITQLFTVRGHKKQLRYCFLD